MTDTAIAADLRAREEASDPSRSIVLQAPAGSGKTTVLTQRFLKLLATVDEPEEILAVTFTRKAAAAMRARIVQALSDDPLLSAKAMGWGLANNPGRLRIQTIDSFNFWIASQLPVTAKAGGTLVVDDRPEELYARAARMTLVEAENDAELAPDIELLFERLDNRWDHVEELLAQMLAERAHWLRHVVGSAPEALRARMTASLRDLTVDALVGVRAQLPADLVALLETLPEVGSLGCGAQDLPGWQRLIAAVLTLKGAWRKPRGRAVTDLSRAIADLSALPGVLDEFLDIRCLPPAELDPDDARALDALSRVLRVAAAYLQIEFASAGRVDHTYIAGAAREALADASLPTDLALRTGLALTHILVDEFQDISLDQFALLEALTVGWEEGDGRTLFVVGDPMQSIYQFREAEVGLFLRIRAQGIGSLFLAPLHLLQNFRSVAPLVEWTNARFATLLASPDDVRLSAVAFRPSLAARAAGTPPAVELTLFVPGERAAEANAVAQGIAALKARNSAATIAVLVSARAHARPISAALGALGIGFVGVKIVPLADLSVIRDLVALTRALHHLADQAAWLVVLRAPWCGASLATLSHLSQRNDPLLLWEALQDEARLSQLSPQERARVLRVRTVLEEALAARAEAPLAEWLESTWIKLGAYDAYPADELSHARALLSAIAERAASGHWRGPRDLDAVTKNLYAEPPATGANPVQIMTIHHAKGLQFDHVFLPCIDRTLNHGKEPLLRTLDLPRRGGGSDLLLAPVPKTGATDGAALGAYIKRLAKVRAEHEQVRVLYVATTRAKESLHISAAPKLKVDGSVALYAGTLLKHLWRALAPEDFNYPVNAAGATAGHVAAPPLRRLIGGWSPGTVAQTPAWPRLPIEQQSLEALEFSWVGETARHIGTVVHAALQRFAGLPRLPRTDEIGAASEDYLRQLRRHGVPEEDLTGAAARVVEALRRSCADERGRWILSSAHQDARSELALTGIARGRLQSIIIDRTFVDAGVRWVIDFKTSSHTGGDLEAFLDRQLERYRSQLENNSELARALGPEPVRAALYLPLLGAFRELAVSEGIGERE